MAAPTTRELFKEYILRKLGAPVIEINVSEEQVEDRVDEAVSFWRDYHYSGSQQVFLKHQITQDTIDNKYFELPAGILGISGIFNFNSSVAAGAGMFNVQYQFVLNNMEDITGYEVQNYYQSMMHIEQMQEILVGQPTIRYNRHVNKLHLDTDSTTLVLGDYLVVEAYDVIDPAVYPDVWGDRWLQNYATLLVKEQWGANLTKFTGVQLVGGLSFNGEAILSEAREERKLMEEEVIQNLQPLSYNFIG